MRRLLFLSALPLLAVGPGTLQIRSASVAWGAGVEPRGPVPPPRFEADVVFEGAKVPPAAELRAWQASASQVPGLKKAAHAQKQLGPQARVVLTVTSDTAGTWHVGGTWPHVPRTEDRVVVELWRRGRRLAWAVSEVDSHPLPVGRPRGDHER